MKKIILDIGSHKLEEINLFYKRFECIHFLFKLVVKVFLFYNKKISRFNKKDKIYKNYSFSKWPVELGLSEHKNLLSHLFRNENTKNFNLIVVEPNIDVSFRKIKNLKKKINLTFFPFILSSFFKEKIISFSNFYVSKNSLSSSIYKKIPMTLLREL